MPGSQQLIETVKDNQIACAVRLRLKSASVGAPPSTPSSDPIHAPYDR